MKLSDYKYLVFDCDGVILNSNKIKTDAFYEATKSYGHKMALALKEHHVLNGGISRYKKFEYFLTKILGRELRDSDINYLLEKFAFIVKKSLLTSDVTEAIETLRSKTQQARWLIVSGGDQLELREVFSEKGLDQFFDGGIFGSPDTKEVILEREIGCFNIRKQGLFIGDSKYDYLAASGAGLDFAFMYKWTEVMDWREWCKSNRIQYFKQVSDLMSLPDN